MILNKHITFPPQYRPLKYDGYLWCTLTHSVYSFKFGTIKPLKYHSHVWDPRTKRYADSGGWQISHKGVTKTLLIDNIERYLIKNKVVAEDI